MVVIIVFNIVTDTASNLTGEMLKEKNISVLPLSFNIEGHSNICMDVTGFDGHAYYDAIRAGAKVTTSQITPQRCIDAMRPLLEQARAWNGTGGLAQAPLTESNLVEMFSEFSKQENMFNIFIIVLSPSSSHA